MEKNYLINELKKNYEQLFMEIELFKSKLEIIRFHNKNFPQNVIHVKNNPDTIVSVITPAYNAGKFLQNLYQSLKNQSIASSIEWIIVDDCSSDNSMEFFAQLSFDKKLGKISVYRNEINMGAATSLKRGFTLASSEVFAWVSADDYYVSENKLEEDLKLINNGFDIVFSRYTILGNDLQTGKKVSVPFVEYSDKHQMLADIMVSNYFNGSSVCIKKATYFESGGINEFLVNVDGDFDLWARNILLGKKIGFSDTTVFNYQHPNQTSNVVERMAVGKNITRLSYVRFLKKNLVCEKFEKDFEMIVHEKYFHFYNSVNTLAFILSQIKSFSFSDINSIRNALYLLQSFFLNSIWLEYLSEKYRYTVFLLNNIFHDISSMHADFREQIYKLSDELMKTEIFKLFSERYKY